MENSTTTFNLVMHEDAGWSEPELVETLVNNDSIELVYTQQQTFWVNISPPKRRCFKVIYSSKNCAWHQSERIYGNIVPAQEESYDFDYEPAPNLAGEGSAPMPDGTFGGTIFSGSGHASFGITRISNDLDYSPPSLVLANNSTSSVVMTMEIGDFSNNPDGSQIQPVPQDEK